MFYESERIIRKNEKHKKTKAYDLISDLKKKGLSNEEMIEAVKILLSDNNNEFQDDVLNKAKSILEALEEIKNGSVSFKMPSTGSISIECPILRLQRKK